MSIREHLIRTRRPHEVQYSLSYKLKSQMYHIWNNYFEKYRFTDKKEVWKTLSQGIAEDIGTVKLYNNGTHEEQVKKYFMDADDPLEALLIIEQIAQAILAIEADLGTGGFQDIKFLINARFVENNFGYHLNENAVIIRTNNHLVHQEITKPALDLIHNVVYQNANEEFMSALDHYRKGRNKECIVDCCKSVETTLKIILTNNKWSYDKGATLKPLIAIALKNGIIPPYLQNHLSGLEQILTNSINVIRNKVAHGQGPERVQPDDIITAYTLNLTASTLTFFIDADRHRSQGTPDA